MADAVTTQVLQNGPRNYAAKFTSFSDGTGEAAVVKLDPTSTGDMGVIFAGQTLYPGTHLKLFEIKYNVAGMALLLQWAATAPADIWYLQGFGHQVFQKQGGLFVPQSAGAPIAGATGKVTFTTKGAAAGSSYSVEIWAKKDIAQ